MIERPRVRIPAGTAGEFTSPGSTFCADSYFGMGTVLTFVYANVYRAAYHRPPQSCNNGHSPNVCIRNVYLRIFPAKYSYGRTVYHWYDTTPHEVITLTQCWQKLQLLSQWIPSSPLGQDANKTQSYQHCAEQGVFCTHWRASFVCFSVALRPQKSSGLFGTGSPGRPPPDFHTAPELCIIYIPTTAV